MLIINWPKSGAMPTSLIANGIVAILLGEVATVVIATVVAFMKGHKATTTTKMVMEARFIPMASRMASRRTSRKDTPGMFMIFIIVIPWLRYKGMAV